MKNSVIISGPQQVLATVLAIELVAPRHFLLVFSAPSIACHARAGQFVHILPRALTQQDPLLRRAFSIMAVRPDEGQVEVLFRVEGQGTAQLASYRVGETLDVLGPLGQPFDVDLFHVKQILKSDGIEADASQTDAPSTNSEEGIQSATQPILVGGGVGVPPLIFLGQTLKAAGHQPLMLIGARSALELIGLRQLNELKIETRLATNDGSAGQQTLVTDLLEAALRTKPNAVIYSCGPLPMLKVVAVIAARWRVPCQVSLEENMPCGIGVCNGCVVAVQPGSAAAQTSRPQGEPAADDRYRRVCTDGPAMWAHRIDWEAF